MIPVFILLRTLFLQKVDFLKNFKPLFIVNLLLLVVLLETIVQHHFFRTDWLIGRFALFLYPLFLLNCILLTELIRESISKKIITAVVLVFALISTIVFFRNLNFLEYGEWSYDSATKSALRVLVTDRNEHNPQLNNVKLGVNWVFEPTLNFYRQIWKLNWLLPVGREGLNSEDNYYYIFNTDMGKLNFKNYRVIFTSDKTNTSLLRMGH